MSEARGTDTASLAWALASHISRRVLPENGRRAAVAAAARRVPGEPRTFGALRETAEFLPEPHDPAAERAFVAVAAMMCDQPRRGRLAELAFQREAADAGETERKRGWTAVSSLGDSCAKAVNLKLQSASSMETRLHAICRSRADGAHRLIPPLVGFLRADAVDVNWPRLIEDLTWWDRRRQAIAARWLREYYRGLNNSAEPSTKTKKKEQQ